MMKLFTKIFGSTKGKPANLYEQVIDVISKRRNEIFRIISNKTNSAPSEKTTDEKMNEIYEKVSSDFREVAKLRGEKLSENNINAIVLQFVRIHEMFGEQYYFIHLKNELERIQKYGFRDEHHQFEIDLFKSY